MRLLALLPLAALLAACGERADAPAAESATADIAPAVETAPILMADAGWTQDYAACGVVLQDQTEWGAGVVSSRAELQEIVAEPGLVLRVWSAADAGLAARDGALTGRAVGPAWIGADSRPDAYLAYLAEGEVGLRVDADNFSCAPAAAAAQSEQ